MPRPSRALPFAFTVLLVAVLHATLTAAQTAGTKVAYQQTLQSSDRIIPSFAQLAYRLASGTPTFLSADDAIVQFNATTVTSLSVQYNMVLSGAASTLTFSGASATFTSSTNTFKLFDSTNTGGLTITLDGSNNPTLASSGTTITSPSKLIAANSIQVSNSTGRLQYSAGDARITSVAQNFTFWNDAGVGGIVMWLDGSKNGYMSTTGGNCTFSGGDFTFRSSSTYNLHVTDGTNYGNYQGQCYQDVTYFCTMNFNLRYLGIANTPYFQRPNAAKTGYRWHIDARSTGDNWGPDIFTGSTNADGHNALLLDTSTPASPYFNVLYWNSGPYAWRQTFATGSGTVTIPSWVKVVYVTVIGAGGEGAQNGGHTAGYGGGGGGCILNYPITINTAYATTMTYSVGARAPTQSGSTTVTYNGYSLIGAGGFAAISGTPGNGGGYTVGSTVSTAGGAGGFPGTAGTPVQPYFFPGGGGGGSTSAGGSAGYIAGVAGDGAGFGAGGSSCLGMGATGTTGPTGAGGGGDSGKTVGGAGYIELFGLGGI